MTAGSPASGWKRTCPSNPPFEFSARLGSSLARSRAFPEIGFYRQQTRLTEYDSNEFLLRQIPASTGGRYNPDPRDVFDP